VITNLALTSDPMHREDRFIAACNSWSEFWERAKKLPSKSEKGAVFERLTQLYLQVTPEYQAELQHVWTIRDVPPNVCRLLDLPTLDEGIDFIARTRHGKYWAIQSKFRSQHDKPLTRRELGMHSKPFATLLSDKKIKIQRRVFMTATERVFRGDRSDVLSMNDSEKDYGARFFELSFKEAIKQRIITDYKILTITVSDGHVRKLIDENRILNLNSRDLDEAEAQAIAAGIALKRIYKRHGVKHAISFHRTIRAADRFREQQDALNRMGSLGPKTTNLHISSKKTAGQRSDLLREFVVHKRALMTNARCLTEGVDVRAIDCVMFADPKQSRVDIVQAAGRALRQCQGKECGYIVVPLVVPEKMDFETFAETTAFRQVAQTLTALSTQDERIADEFRAIESGQVSSGKSLRLTVMSRSG
jgi:predicted helicase